MTYIDKEWLEKYGVANITAKEAKQLSLKAIKELEIRVGDSLVQRFTDQQISDFEKLTDEDKQLEWLEKACPNYKRIVAVQAVKLGNEIKKSKNKIKLISSW